MRKAVFGYKNTRDTNQLAIVESFYLRFPNHSSLPLHVLRLDGNTIPFYVRLLKQTPEASAVRGIALYNLIHTPESDELLKMFVETALNRRESEENRLEAIFSLMDSKWTNREPALIEIFLKLKEEKYHERMLDVAIYNQKAALAEVFLGCYHRFHPERDFTYAKHHARYHEMKARLDADAQKLRPFPVIVSLFGGLLGLILWHFRLGRSRP